MKQITDTVLMVRPLHFCMNEETALSNYFQRHTDERPEKVLQKAQSEFDTYVKILNEAGIKVIVVEDRPDAVTPDSIFPNNWISFHENGDVALYPMCAENRRLERREDIIEQVVKAGFEVERIIDLSDAEEQGFFLEGTGSIILDRENSLAYCALSTRSDEELFSEFCEIFGYRPIIFNAYQNVGDQRLHIYHTNVMLTIGESFAVLCADSVDDPAEKERVIRSLKRTEKEIIFISEEQMAAFAGNMLQVSNMEGERFLIMSSTAYRSLNQNQLDRLNKHTELLQVDIPTIEQLGGGSARCMLAEVFHS
ncbi:MAG: citrulline utilization hydrolase CtlX [Flavobacteriia bacterium]|jgi:hypothetical protein